MDELTLAKWLFHGSAGFVFVALPYFLYQWYEEYRFRRRMEAEARIEAEVSARVLDSNANGLMAMWSQEMRRKTATLTKEQIHENAEKCRESEHITQAAFEEICRLLDENRLQDAHAHLEISHLK